MIELDLLLTEIRAEGPRSLLKKHNGSLESGGEPPRNRALDRDAGIF